MTSKSQFSWVTSPSLSWLPPKWIEPFRSCRLTNSILFFTLPGCLMYSKYCFRVRHGVSLRSHSCRDARLVRPALAGRSCVPTCAMSCSRTHEPYVRHWWFVRLVRPALVRFARLYVPTCAMSCSRTHEPYVPTCACVSMRLRSFAVRRYFSVGTHGSCVRH